MDDNAKLYSVDNPSKICETIINVGGCSAFSCDGLSENFLNNIPCPCRNNCISTNYKDRKESAKITLEEIKKVEFINGL